MPHILLLLTLLFLATACGPSFEAPPGSMTTPTTCAVDCDCPQGQLCNNGTCKQGAGPLYCCDKAGCPSGERCVDTTGAVDTCGECVVSCDCPQGQLCADGACVITETPVYCCDAPGCPVNQGCVDLEEQVQVCPPECTTDCDCPQGLACSSSGLCLETSPPTYCCDNGGCPDGEICRTATGDRDVCGPKTVEPECGNNMIEDGETCDGNCPTSCDDGNACTADTLVGQGTCTAECRNEVVTSCQSGDGCCPMGCSFANDTDCPQPQLCGNGRLDAGESCDGDCPTSCNDNDACTTDVLTGSAGTCTAQCSFQPQTQCVSGDGCCPNGCNNATDSDCSPPMSNGAVGDSCVLSDQCTGLRARCIAQADQPLYRNGYCTRDCTADADCDANSHCSMSTGQCVKTCRSSGECRAGYACVDDDADTVRECVPAGGNIGDPCTDTSECRGPDAECAAASEGLFRGGYCTRSCTGDRACGVGATCTNNANNPTGICLKTCNGAADCRGQGYTCADTTNDGTTSCVATNDGPGRVGDPCEGFWSCGPSADQCLQSAAGLGQFPGGVCTRSCGALGGGAACDPGTVCAGGLGGGFPIPLGESYCLEECTRSSDCRAGWTCQTQTNPFTMTSIQVCLGPA